MIRLETDVAVVGAGTAGMAAAVSAAEGGARVMVFEKTGDVAWGGVGMFAVEMFLRHAHYRSNARLIGEYVERAANDKRERDEWATSRSRASDPAPRGAGAPRPPQPSTP